MPRISWNSGFNEAAQACGLSADGLLAVPDMSDAQIGDCLWSRRGSKIHVALGNAFWTVDVADIAMTAATVGRIAEFEAVAARAGMRFLSVRCVEGGSDG